MSFRNIGIVCALPALFLFVAVSLFRDLKANKNEENLNYGNDNKSFEIQILGTNVPTLDKVLNQKFIETKINLYQGFLIKQDGRLYWSSQEPILIDEKFELQPNFVEITSIINDPWPYTPGNSSCILKVIR